METRTSSLHQLSWLLIFTQVKMLTKEQEIQQWMSEEQTYTVIVPINEMFIYTISLVFGIISTEKKITW